MKSVESVSWKLLQMDDTESVFVDIAPGPVVVHLPETELKKEDITEDGLIDPLEPPVKEEESDHCDLESKIQIEEDNIFKTESEFVQEINENSCIELQTVVDYDDESSRKEEDEFSNRV